MKIDVKLPGMEKEDIEFNIYENGFYLIAKKKGLKYMVSCALASPGEPGGALATYSSVLPAVHVPCKKPLFERGAG
jgi:HSP20 family molecular chaperone IbpA